MNSYIYEIECNNVPISDGDFIDLIYLGCTKKIPEKRYKEHKTGKRANKFAQFYGTNLKSFPQNFLDSEYLVELEQLHAETLRTNGHYVVSGKEAYRDKPIICPKCYDKTLAIGCDRKKKTPLIFCDNEECTFKCDVLNTFNFVFIKIGDSTITPKKNLKKAAVKTLVSCWASFIKTDIAALKKTDKIIKGI